MNTEPEILKALLGPEALEEFFSDYWPDRIFVAHAARSLAPHRGRPATPSPSASAWSRPAPPSPCWSSCACYCCRIRPGANRSTARGAPVLRWIDEQRGSFQVSELTVKFPELTEDQHLQLVQSLTGAGLLKVHWFPKLKEK